MHIPDWKKSFEMSPEFPHISPEFGFGDFCICKLRCQGTQLSQAIALLQQPMSRRGLIADVSRRHCAYLTHHAVAIEPKSPMKAYLVAGKSV